MEKVSKKEIVKRTAEKAGVTQDQAREVLNGFVEVVSEALSAGAEVRFSGLGTFYITKRKARTMRNPQTGESMEVPESRYPGFRCGSVLKNAVK